MAQTTNNKKPAFTANKAKTAPKKETTNIYPKGIICFNPHENAPDFVVGKCIIALADLQDFIAENSNLIHNHETYGEQLKLDILRGEKGLYMKVDTFGLDK